MKPQSLRIAICHFHLKTGGVTRVIEHALQALAGQDVTLAVLSGEAPTTALPQGVRCRVVRGFGYEESREPLDAVDLAARLRTAARELLGDDPDVWHFHNHCLGKNLAAAGAIRKLAEQGRPVLLHIHDFAEDGRPALYRRMLGSAGSGEALAEQLYPVAEHIHYAVLNGRDLGVLRAAGVPAQRIHLLPNAVWLPRSEADTSAALPFDSQRRLWLYPTRAIRRKNIGELLLWAANTGHKEDLFATTQAPQNPAERPVYERWKQLAEELKLPVSFELGMRFEGDFLHLLQSAHALVSTSITEGFGLAFLEPWLVERPVAGRNLPEITDDFAALGIDLGGLYERLPVPLEWIGETALRRRIRTGLKRSMEAYAREPSDRDEELAWQTFVQPDGVDFGRLDEPLQEQVLRRAATSAEPLWEQPAGMPLDTSVSRIHRNRRLIAAQFGLTRYAERLAQIYRQLAEADPSPLSHASASAVLDAFLSPQRLYLLKT